MLNITGSFLNIWKNSLNIHHFCFENEPILNHLGKNFLAVVKGVEKENPGTTLENCSFGAGSDMTLLEYMFFQVGNR